MKGQVGVKRKIVNVDLDGVVYDFVGAMRSAFDYRHNIDAGERYESDPKDWPDPSQWSIWKEWPISYDEFYRVMYAEIRDNFVFRQGAPIEGAVEGMEALGDIGFHVRIVTSKTFRDKTITEKARRSTLSWLATHDIHYDTIAFSDAEQGKTSYKAHVVIDDKPKVETWAQPDALNIIFHQRWNRTIGEFPDMAEGGGVFCRAQTWEQVVGFARLEAGYLDAAL